MENELNIKQGKNDGFVNRLGFWSSLFITVLGISYFIVVVLMLVTGNFKLPPPELVQIYAAVMDLLLCPSLIVLIVSIHNIVPHEKRVFTQLGLVFSGIFTTLVTMNRFIQISVVRLSMIEGDLEGLRRFYAYDPRSIMFALELFGFGFFLSIALFFVAISLSSEGLQRKAKYAFIIYSILGMTSVTAYVLNSLITNIGFIAWGLVLYIGTGFMTAFFYKRIRQNINREENYEGISFSRER